MKEWLNHQTDSWDLEGALKQYNMVKISEAEFQGLPAPTFEGELSIPSGAETEKTPSPSPTILLPPDPYLNSLTP